MLWAEGRAFHLGRFLGTHVSGSFLLQGPGLCSGDLWKFLPAEKGREGGLLGKAATTWGGVLAIRLSQKRRFFYEHGASKARGSAGKERNPSLWGKKGGSLCNLSSELGDLYWWGKVLQGSV